MGRVLVVGSANCDFVFQSERLPAPGETVLGTSFKTTPGGKGANQAVAIGRLGGAVDFCGAIGADMFGNELRLSLSDAGVGLDLLRGVEAPTGTAAVLVDERGANQIVVAPGANAFVSSEQVEDAIARTGPTIVLAQLEVPMAAVEAASRAERFVLNPAPARPVPEEILSRCFAITPNETETGSLTGIRPDDEPSCHRAADRLLERGVRNVVITLGERGCFWKTVGVARFIRPPKVRAIDTTAAGDAFSGALAHFLAEGHEFASSLELASAVAALGTTRLGAQASMPTRQELDAAITAWRQASLRPGGGPLN